MVRSQGSCLAPTLSRAWLRRPAFTLRPFGITSACDWSLNRHDRSVESAATARAMPTDCGSSSARRPWGFTLAEVASLLTLQKRRSCHATRELAAAKLRLIDARIQELRGLRRELAGLIADCDANTQDTKCPVIQRLAS